MINNEGCVDAAHSTSIFFVFQIMILWLTEHSHTLKVTLPLWSYLTPYLGDLQLSLYFPKSWPGWRDTSTKRSRHISLYTDKQCHQAQMWCYQQKEFAPSWLHLPLLPLLSWWSTCLKWEPPSVSCFHQNACKTYKNVHIYTISR